MEGTSLREALRRTGLWYGILALPLLVILVLAGKNSNAFLFFVFFASIIWPTLVALPVALLASRSLLGSRTSRAWRCIVGNMTWLAAYSLLWSLIHYFVRGDATEPVIALAITTFASHGVQGSLLAFVGGIIPRSATAATRSPNTKKHG